MKQPMYKLFWVIAVITAALGNANADEVQTPHVAVIYNENCLTPVSHDDNSFTFAFPDHPIYEPSGGAPYIIRDFYAFSAQPHYALTGKMNVQVNANYHLENAPGVTADINTGFDVLLPRCDACNPYDSTLLGSSSNYQRIDTGSSLHVDAGTTAASGTYDRLWLYLVINPRLSNNAGPPQLTTLTLTAETIQTSAVPELPPVAMLTLGLAVLGVRAGFKSGKNRSVAAAAKAET